MDFAYTFGDPEILYLNVTNRCTNSCAFCVRNFTPNLGSGHLRGRPGEPEPRSRELLEAINKQGDLENFEEIVWCGYGEPTFRLDLILEMSPLFRETGVSVRLNTNGHGCAIHGRDILPDLGDAIDVVSVSLNAPTSARYFELCDPDPTACLGAEQPEELWEALLDFIRRAPEHIADVRVSVVAHVLDDDEIRECRALASRLGCQSLRLR